MDLPITTYLPKHDPKMRANLPRIDIPLSAQDSALLGKAKALEAGFLAEMLGHAGLDTTSENFGGGIGEQQFASFLRAEQAKAMVAKGGIGLAQQIFHALKERASDAQ